jgi:hypothetical protein
MSRARSPFAPAPRWRQRLLATALALAAEVARAADECRYGLETADGGARQVERLSVGETDRRVHRSLLRIVNLGLHDLRLTFEGRSARLLASGASEPVHGALPPGARLTGIECLLSRSSK